MAIILSIESSGEAGSVALHQSGTLLANTIHIESNSHSSTLALQVQNVLKEANVSLDDLVAIAVSAGPGSYTGLRIGASLAKGLAFSTNLPLIAIDTLKIMAAPYLPNLVFDELLFCTIDARRNEVYASIINFKNEYILEPQALILPEELPKEYLSERLFLVEYGEQKVAKLLNIIGNKHFEVKAIDAINMGVMAYEAYQKNEFVNLIDFQPNYLKEAFITQVKNKQQATNASE